MKNSILGSLALALTLGSAVAQTKGLVNNDASPYAKLHTVGLGDVKWTKGFWAERFDVCRQNMLPALWQTYTQDTVCSAFDNFKKAAGLLKGDFIGPSFHDGDFYKSLEAVAAVYSSTRDPKLNRWMDDAIAVIAKAQRKDGYIYTKSIIEQRQEGKLKMFDDKLSFEAYNFGHLMTTACVHYRVTGKRNLLNVAEKAADFLIGFYNNASPEQARNAICPAHYMGLAELYRTTGEKRFLSLLQKLIDIRGTVEGTDDNSDRAPFRDMRRIVGHAVRANYLMAGVADLYAEDGDKSLLNTLDTLWENVTNTKMYVTGGCGALYDGVSVDGTSYNPDTVQKVHQAYGRDFQLPNETAHNETCANIGNVLFNWRMFMLSGDVKYMNVLEQTLYNSVLSGVSMDGLKYFYTNPLAHNHDFPYHMRWEGGRIPYIKLSNCCPPNVVRTIAEVGNYMYNVSGDAVYFNMYGGNDLKTQLKDGSKLALSQVSNYPWDGQTVITVTEAPKRELSFMLRIPGWCTQASLAVNGKVIQEGIAGNQYLPVKRQWKKGDIITLKLNMEPSLIVANPLVEAARNQVAVQRGPIVYCLESPDMPGHRVFDVTIPADISLKAENGSIAGGTVVTLSGIANLRRQDSWKGKLYQPLNKGSQTVPVKLIPYYAWANRGESDMTVWLPVTK